MKTRYIIVVVGLGLLTLGFMVGHAFWFTSQMVCVTDDGNYTAGDCAVIVASCDNQDMCESTREPGYKYTFQGLNMSDPGIQTRLS